MSKSKQNVKIDLTGDKELKAALKKAEDLGPLLLDRALYLEALDIFEASQVLVPVRDGILKGSGVVEPPKDHTVLIGYGGAAKKYAVIVHEDMKAQHANPTVAKYLEIPFVEAQKGLQRRLSQQIGKDLENGRNP
jgi:hypothetical protein